jgi:hypothetical protein
LWQWRSAAQMTKRNNPVALAPCTILCSANEDQPNKLNKQAGRAILPANTPICHTPMKVNPCGGVGSTTGPSTCPRKLVVLYGIGGLSDVGRHAILAVMEKNVENITVITEYPDMLDDKNWECGCPDGHINPFKDAAYASKLTMVKIDSWKNDQPYLSQHFQDADAVISCLGHRQPGWKHKELIKNGLIAHDGSKQVIKAMEEANVSRVVAISSVGLNYGDKSWNHWASKLMSILFLTFMHKARKDLQAMEKLYTESSLNYLIVRPVGISEDVVPVGTYFVQEEGKEVLGGNMAKMDVARFMAHEAIQPSKMRGSVVVGSAPGTPM